MDDQLERKLQDRAQWLRRETLRIHKNAPETRVASSLSNIETLVTMYYGDIIKYNASEPFADDRDRFIISKGHGSICMYPLLADLGFFDASELEKVCKPGSFLGGIPDTIIPGYETINGSLGHGVGVACGVATALKNKNSPRQVYVMTGDGELNEGSIWEAVQFAGHHKLDNFTIVVDNNRTSMMDFSANIINLDPLADKFTPFNFEAIAVDGHSVTELHEGFTKLRNSKAGKAKVLIANTVKAKGIKSLETNPMSHVIGVPKDEIEELLR